MSESEQALVKDLITITPSAFEFIQDKLAKQPSNVGLRLALNKGGCSGYTYSISFAKEYKEEDTVIEQKGIKVILDKDSLPFFQKMTINCVRDDFGEYLEFNNPNVKGECGCGESVSFNEG